MVHDSLLDPGSVPGWGKSPGEGKGYPLQYSGQENSMDYTVHSVVKSWTQLSNLHFHFNINCNLWVIVMCQCRLLNCSKYTTLVGEVDNGDYACVLSHFNCVQLLVTLLTVAHQAVLSMGSQRVGYDWATTFSRFHNFIANSFSFKTKKRKP